MKFLDVTHTEAAPRDDPAAADWSCCPLFPHHCKKAPSAMLGHASAFVLTLHLAPDETKCTLDALTSALFVAFIVHAHVRVVGCGQHQLTKYDPPVDDWFCEKLLGVEVGVAAQIQPLLFYSVQPQWPSEMSGGGEALSMSVGRDR